MAKTPETATSTKPQAGVRARVVELYRCYFISRDGKGLSLASVMAHDATSAVAAAIARFPRLKFKAVEVWLNKDRVLTAEHRGLLPQLT